MVGTSPITPSGGWQAVLADPGARAHTVQLYTDLEFLTRAVSHYAGTGLQRNEAVIFVATHQHREAFSKRLHADGFAVDRLQAQGQLTILDAAETLARFMVNGRPVRSRFAPLLGNVIDGAAARFPRVRAYGEMVNLLWEDGELAPALELEELWNELGTTRPFSLHCAYALDIFDGVAHCCALQGVQHAHTHFIPVEDYARYDRAIERALSDVMGPTESIVLKSVLLDRQEFKTDMPETQKAVLGLSELLPTAAKAVLARARKYYGMPRSGGRPA